jgi:hypothetical protein
VEIRRSWEKKRRRSEAGKKGYKREGDRQPEVKAESEGAESSAAHLHREVFAW